MTDLVLAGYAYSALICFIASCALIAAEGKKGRDAVIIVLSNVIITVMLIYGALHT